MMSHRPTGNLSEDEIFELLANPRRRFVLLALREDGQGIALTDIADSMAGASREVTLSELTPSDRKNAYVSLYQTHVPYLVDAGVVTYSSDSGVVTLTDGADVLFPYLELAEADVDWARRYLLIAGAGLLVYIAVAFVGTPSQLAISGVFLLGCFIIVGALHRRTLRPSGRRRGRRRITPPWT
ncbi:hypothetical protein JCM18237_27660 [Halorubrum luteum]